LGEDARYLVTAHAARARLVRRRPLSSGPSHRDL